MSAENGEVVIKISVEMFSHAFLLFLIQNFGNDSIITDDDGHLIFINKCDARSLIEIICTAQYETKKKITFVQNIVGSDLFITVPFM